MTEGYAEPDWEIVDYQMYCLDSEVIDRQTRAALQLRGPKPQRLEPGNYFVCLGAAQTFGRFCEKPYPTLLQERLGIQALNFGRGGAGPSFFSEDNEKLLQYINRARFAIIQVMTGRSESNSLFDSKGLGFYTRVSDGTWIGCDDAFTELLEKYEEGYVKKIVAETRNNWTDSYKKLLSKIQIPKILFWFSVRKPHYAEKYKNINTLFGEFPQLVNSQMVNGLKNHCNDYVECVSRKGIPHLLINRFTGKPTTVKDPWGGIWNKNWYYPSPEMHSDGVDALENACRRHLNQVETRQSSKLALNFGRWILKREK